MTPFKKTEAEKGGAWRKVEPTLSLTEEIEISLRRSFFSGHLDGTVIDTI